MQVKPEQLPARLKSNNLPIVWISGDDPLLAQEACDAVRKFAREQGFTEREVLDVGPHFNWDQLLASSSSLSLFAERKLIDVRLASGKLDEAAREALNAYAGNANPDNLLLLTTGKIEKAAQSTKWFAALEGRALFCALWPPKQHEMADWVEQRLQKHGLTADREAIEVLAERIEGNLLAADQEIEKLRLQVSGTQLDAKTVMDAVADNSRFSTWTLSDACLAGNSARALNILYHLRDEGEQPLAVLGQMCKEIRALAGILADVSQGRELHAAMQMRGVWSSKTQLFNSALERHSQASLQKLLERARIVDQSVKGLLDNQPWDELARLALGLSDPRLAVSVV